MVHGQLHSCSAISHSFSCFAASQQLQVDVRQGTFLEVCRSIIRGIFVTFIYGEFRCV